MRSTAQAGMTAGVPSSAQDGELYADSAAPASGVGTSPTATGMTGLGQTRFCSNMNLPAHAVIVPATPDFADDAHEVPIPREPPIADAKELLSPKYNF